MTRFQSARRPVILVVGMALVAILGVAGWFWWQARHATQAVAPRTGPLVEAVYGLGTVIAPETFQVRSAVNQSIQEIFVKEGDSVAAGAPLAKFDESGAVRAPFAGTVTSVPLRKGELLFPSTPALTLVNLGNLYLEVSLEQQTVLRVARDQKAIVSFESLRGERVDGRVRAVFPRETQFIVRIELGTFPPGILPGMTADVAIEIGRRENVLSIPLRAISNGRVTLRRQGRQVKQAVRIGVVDGQWAEVTSGNVEPEDEILVRAP